MKVEVCRDAHLLSRWRSPWRERWSALPSRHRPPSTANQALDAARSADAGTYAPDAFRTAQDVARAPRRGAESAESEARDPAIVQDHDRTRRSRAGGRTEGCGRRGCRKADGQAGGHPRHRVDPGGRRPDACRCRQTPKECRGSGRAQPIEADLAGRGGPRGCGVCADCREGRWRRPPSGRGRASTPV